MATEAQKQAVLSRVDGLEQELVKLLCQLIRIPSLNLSIAGAAAEQYRGQEGEVSRLLAQRMEALGLVVDLWEEVPGRTNAVGRLAGSGQGRSLIFNGHVDVVDPGDSALWTACLPFEPKVAEGRVWGRGACDMKGGDAAALIALQAVLESGLRPAGDVLVEYVVGEEMMEHELGASATVKRGYRADGAVVMEPTAPPHALAIAPCCCNVGYLVIQVQGKATHACLRGSMTRAGGLGEAQGVSAIDKAFLIYEGLQRLDAHWALVKKNPLYEPGHFNLHPGVVNGGACGAFAVADACTLEYSIWAPPQETPEAVKSQVEEAIHDICQTDPWLRKNLPALFWPAFWPSYNLPLDSPLAQATAQAVEQATGCSACFHGFVGSNDASWLERGGTPSLSLGPGDLTVAHAPNEYVEINQLLAAARSYALLLLDWCGVQ